MLPQDGPDQVRVHKQEHQLAVSWLYPIPSTHEYIFHPRLAVLPILRAMAAQRSTLNSPTNRSVRATYLSVFVTNINVHDMNRHKSMLDYLHSTRRDSQKLTTIYERMPPIWCLYPSPSPYHLIADLTSSDKLGFEPDPRPLAGCWSRNGRA